LPDITTIQDQIRDRLTEVEKLIEPLRAEADQLTKMAATFAAAAASHTPARIAAPRKSAARKPRAAAAAKTGGAKRGRPLGSGNRAQQAVAKIVEQPGITASELAKSMGISPNYLYRVLPRLEREAKVVKQGRGYHPAGDVEESAAKNGQPVAA
jgi:DNA invertase Pin-like site-specific DNA recombinase